MSDLRNSWDSVDAMMRQGTASTFPAAVLLVQQRGHAVFYQAYGWLQPEHQHLPTRKDTLFDLASLTKLFTATAFMHLVAEKKISLHTPISEVLPELQGRFPILPGMDPYTKTPLPPDPTFHGQVVDARQITFWHLLTHTAGLAAWMDCCQPPDASPVPLPSQVSANTRRRRLQAVLRAPRFVYPPGQRLLYSDVGFILLGEAIERLAGMSLPAYFDQAIQRPLGMSQVTFTPLRHGVPCENIAPTELCAWRGRRLWGEVHDENAACLAGVAGHAGLFASAADVAKLGQSFLETSERPLPDSLKREMTREQAWMGAERRGLGWKLQTPTQSPVGQAFSSRSFGHTGFTGTSLWVDPDRELVVALLTNRVYDGRDGDAIARFRVRLHEAVVATVDASLEERP